MSIFAVIWDLGGVLVRTEDWEPRTRLAARLNMSVDHLGSVVFGPGHDMRAQRGEITLEEHWEHVARILGVHSSEIDSVRAEFFRGDRLDTSLLDYIRTLKKNYTTAVLSNALSNLRSLIFDDWAIGDAFHRLFISAEIGLVKPDPAIYYYTLEQLSFEPYEAIFIDDSQENVEAARRIGMHAIQYHRPEQVRSQLDHMLKDISLELP